MIINKKNLTLSFLLSSSLFATTYTDYNQMLASNSLNIPAIEVRIQQASTNITMKNLDNLNNFQNTNSKYYDWSYNCVQDLGCNFIKSSVYYGSEIDVLNGKLSTVENKTNTEINSINTQQTNYTSSKVAMYNGGVKTFLTNTNVMSGINEQTDAIDDIRKMDYLITSNGLYKSNFEVLTQDGDIQIYENLGDAVELEYKNEYTNRINTEKIVAKKTELEYYRSQIESLKTRALRKKDTYLAMPDTVMESKKSNVPVLTTETVGTSINTTTTTSSYGILSDNTDTTGIITETTKTNNPDGISRYEVIKSCTTNNVSADVTTEDCNFTKNEINTTVTPNTVTSSLIVGSTLRTITKGYSDVITNDVNNNGNIIERPQTTTVDANNITTISSTTKTCSTSTSTSGVAPNDIISTETTTCDYVKNVNANGSYTETYITNDAKVNGLSEVDGYLNTINESLNDLNKDIDLLNGNLSKIAEANKEELYLRKLTDVTQQFQLSLFLRMAYEDYALRNDLLYDKNIAYQIYSGSCKTEAPNPSVNTGVTMTTKMLASYKELCTIHKQAEDLSFVMNKLKQSLQLALQSYLLGEFDFGIFDAMLLPPTDEVGLDLPLISADVKSMYTDNLEFVSKFTEKIVVDMTIVSQNYPLNYQLVNRDLYKELEAFANNGKSIAIDNFIESINSPKVPFRDCDYTGCVTSTVTNIEQMFMRNDYLLSKDSLTEIEKSNNLKFIGNLLKMNRLVKRAEAKLEINATSGNVEVTNVTSVFNEVFPVNTVYLTVADYKVAYKLKNDVGSDNTNEGRNTLEEIVRHIASGDRPVTGGSGSLYPSNGRGGSGSSGTNGTTGGGIIGTGGGTGGATSNPYGDNFNFTPSTTDYSSNWEGGLIYLDDYIRRIYENELLSSGFKDIGIKQQIVNGTYMYMLYDYAERGRSNLLHNDNRVLKDKIKFEYNDQTNFLTNNLLKSKVIKGLNDNGVVTPNVNNNFNRADIPLMKGSSPITNVSTEKSNSKTISSTSMTLSSGAKCVGLNASCTNTTHTSLPYTQTGNWGK